MGWNSLHNVCMEGKTNDIEEEIMKKGIYCRRRLFSFRQPNIRQLLTLAQNKIPRYHCRRTIWVGEWLVENALYRCMYWLKEWSDTNDAASQGLSVWSCPLCWGASQTWRRIANPGTERGNRKSNECAIVGTITHISVQYGSTCLHWAVKGFVHNKADSGYKKDAYINIVKNLLGVSSKLLDYKNAVFDYIDPLYLLVSHSAMCCFFRNSKLPWISFSRTVRTTNENNFSFELDAWIFFQARRKE